MKPKLIKDFNVHYKKGYEVEIEIVVRDARFVGGYGVKVTNMGKQPRWLSIEWVTTIPNAPKSKQDKKPGHK